MRCGCALHSRLVLRAVTTDYPNGISNLRLRWIGRALYWRRMGTASQLPKLASFRHSPILGPRAWVKGQSVNSVLPDASRLQTSKVSVFKMASFRRFGPHHSVGADTPGHRLWFHRSPRPAPALFLTAGRLDWVRFADSRRITGRSIPRPSRSKLASFHRIGSNPPPPPRSGRESPARSIITLGSTPLHAV